MTLILFPAVSQAFELSPPEKFHNGLSLQGFTGILNTPSAHVTREGDFYALYSNQKESNWRDRTRYQDNYFFNVGMFSIAEIGGRLTWAPEVGAQDISANFKFTSEPFFKKYPYVPVLALGMEDASGGASFFETKYAVITEDIWRLRLSAGYGTGPDRMDGLFAGGEFKAHDWLYLLADYDTRETNVGARIVLPHFWKIPISFTATAKTSLDHKPGNIDIGVGFSLPLDFKVRKEVQNMEAVQGEEAIHSGEAVQSSTFNVEPGTSNIASPTSNIDHTLNPPSPASPTLALSSLRDRLVKAGFMNIRVGEKDGHVVVVEYENTIFNHNEMDALGVVMGMTFEAVKGGPFDRLNIVIKKKNIRMMQLGASLAAVEDFLENGRDIDLLKSEITISNTVKDNSEINFVAGNVNSSFLSTSLLLWPGLSTFVGTDYSAFDYVLSLKPELFTNLWSGGVINARWDIPLLWSENLEEGKPYRNSRTPSRIDRLMLFQGVKLLPNVMANLGAGMLMHGLYGTMNELSWQPGDGAHRIRLAQSWGRNDGTQKEIETYLASYRYYFSPLDVSLEGTAGKFWSKDTGFSVELKRFFGDAAFSLYYKKSTIKESMSLGLPTNWQAVGVQLAFPLTPEKDMKHYYKMQVRGTDEWQYAQETTIASGNSANANYLPPVPLAVAPVFTGSLHNQYMNRDRLSASYIKSHLERLREAWIKYRERM